MNWEKILQISWERSTNFIVFFFLFDHKIYSIEKMAQKNERGNLFIFYLKPCLYWSSMQTILILIVPYYFGIPKPMHVFFIRTSFVRTFRLRLGQNLWTKPILDPHWFDNLAWKRDFSFFRIFNFWHLFIFSNTRKREVPGLLDISN